MDNYKDRKCVSNKNPVKAQFMDLYCELMVVCWAIYSIIVYIKGEVLQWIDFIIYVQLDLHIGEPMQICIHWKDISPKTVNYRLILKEGPKVKPNNIRRFPAHDILQVAFTLQTSRINNKQVISTFKFGCPCLTLKEGLKVKSEHIRRLPAHDFLQAVFTLQTSRTNNKRVISTFKFGYPRFTSKAKLCHTLPHICLYIHLLLKQDVVKQSRCFLESPSIFPKFINLKLISTSPSHMMLQNAGMICHWKFKLLLHYHVLKGDLKKLICFRSLSLLGFNHYRTPMIPW